MGAVCGCGAARRRAESAALTGTTGSLCPSSRRRSLERVLRRCCLLVCPTPVRVGSAACPVRPATCRRAAAAHRPLEGRPLPSQCVSAAAVRQHGRTRGFAVPDAWWSLAYGGWLVPDRS